MKTREIFKHNFTRLETESVRKISCENNANVNNNRYSEFGGLNYSASFNKSMIKMQSVSFKGWAPENEENTEKIKEIVNLIKSQDAKRIAISGHKSPDADSIGSCFGLAELINKSTGKPVDVFIFDDLSEKYSFLNKNENVRVHIVYTHEQEREKDLTKEFGKYDLAIAVDTAKIRLMADNYYRDIFSNATKTVKIDHHPIETITDEATQKTTDNKYAQINLIDTTANSATQLIMQFMEPMGIKPEQLPSVFHENIFCGLLSDTGGFNYIRNHKSFSDAALLVQQGVKCSELKDKIFDGIPKEVFDVRKYALNLVCLTDDGKIAYFVRDEEMKRLQDIASEKGYRAHVSNESKRMVQDLLNIDGVEISFYKTGPQFSVRSKDINVSGIAQKYGGGGHPGASAFQITTDEPEEDIVKRVIADYTSELKKQGK